MVLPVVTHGYEVWGIGENDLLDRVYLMYWKYIFGLNTSTPNCFIHRELGRCPVDVMIKTSIISYWSRIVYGNRELQLTNLMYKALFELHTTNVYRSE